MKKKSEFEAPYIGIETIDNTPIFYNRRGDYSVIIKCENPIIQYSADMIFTTYLLISSKY